MECHKSLTTCFKFVWPMCASAKSILKFFLIGPVNFDIWHGLYKKMSCWTKSSATDDDQRGGNNKEDGDNDNDDTYQNEEGDTTNSRDDIKLA